MTTDETTNPLTDPDLDPADALWQAVSTETCRAFVERLNLGLDRDRRVTLDLAEGDEPFPHWIADVYFEAARPRDYTTDRHGMAAVVHATADLLVDHAPEFRGAQFNTAMDLVEIAGREHQFCAERVSAIGAGYRPGGINGPYLCGAPLDNPWHVGAHVTTTARGDRNLRLSLALSELRRAVTEQASAGQPDPVTTLLHGLVCQVEGTIGVLKALDEVNES